MKIVARRWLLVSGFWLFLLATSNQLQATAYADIVYTTSGDSIKGLVVEEHHDRVVLSTEEGERPILKKEIDEVFYDDAERNYLYLGNQALEIGDFTLAKGFFQKALQIAPEFLEAQDGLHRLEDRRATAANPGSVPKDPAAFLQKSLGLHLAQKDNWIFVEAVESGSLSAQAGFDAGDIFISVWGDSLGFIPLEEAAQVLVGPPGSERKLTIERVVEIRWPGVHLEMGRLGLTVDKLEQGSPAAGILAPQDRIVAIGEKATRYMPLEEARRLLDQGRRGGVRVRIHRDLLFKRN